MEIYRQPNGRYTIIGLSSPNRVSTKTKGKAIIGSREKQVLKQQLVARTEKRQERIEALRKEYMK